MTDLATGRQRLFAKALGITSADRMDRDAVSKAITDAKSRRADPPNTGQLATAQSWGIDLSKAKTSGAATDGLWKAALARVYVYSILRRAAEADWHYHTDCPVSESWINRVAIDLRQDWKRSEIVEEMDNSLSGTKGDAWVRFGKLQAQTAAFAFVEAAINRDSVLAQMASGPKKSARRPPQSKDQGCLSLLLSIIAAAAVPIVWLVF
jgi:hypothetical protein